MMLISVNISDQTINVFPIDEILFAEMLLFKNSVVFSETMRK